MIEIIKGFEISNISELLIIIMVYSIYESIKYYKKKSSSCKNREKFERQIKRLEYLNAVQHFPHKEEWIKRLYGEYKALGGNSYVDNIHMEWLLELKIKKENHLK